MLVHRGIAESSGRPALLFALLSLLSSAGCAHTIEVAPLAIRDESPVVRTFGLPVNAGADVVSQGETTLDFRTTYSSDYALSADSLPDKVLFDGETARLSLHGRVGLGSGVELGLEIPWLAHSGGVLDRFILGYHQLFGFDQGSRDLARNNQLDFSYRRDGVERFGVRQAGAGLGDVQLSAGIRLLQGGPAGLALALRASLELPTGDPRKLMGSGSFDLALYLSASAHLALPLGRAEAWASLGALGMTDGALLPDLQNHVVVFGEFGLGWRVVPGLALKVQVDAHSTFFSDTRTVPMGMPVAQFIGGVSVALWRNTSLDFGLVEDLTVMAAPDVGLHAALRSFFD
ncbi:MAG: DUF3187 family protein [Myxococcales bacterium]